MPLDKLFVTPVFHVDLPEVAQSLIEMQYEGAKSYIENDLSDTTWGDNIKTTYHNEDKNSVMRYELGGLKEFTTPVVKYFSELLYKENYSYMFESWINYQGKHQHQRQHTHPAAKISAVYYIKCNGNDGNLTFHAPLSTMEQGIAASDEWNYSMVSYPPVAGRLFVFPSWVPHSVGDNMTDDTRVSVAMNFR
jgi:uncharacterized protein (TIGR02466 family)